MIEIRELVRTIFLARYDEEAIRERRQRHANRFRIERMVQPDDFYNQHTGVLREYRGRGIAVALKALALDYAKRQGGRHLRTHNHSDNTAMLDINKRFGYHPEPGRFELERKHST